MGIPFDSLPPAIRRRIDPSSTPAALLPGVSVDAREKAIAKDEREIQKQISSFLRLRGIWADSDAMHKRRSGTVGTPDFVFPYKGHFVAWEIKCPWSPRLRPEQVQARDAIIAQGGQWRRITSLAEAQQHLREIDAANRND